MEATATFNQYTLTGICLGVASGLFVYMDGKQRGLDLYRRFMWAVGALMMWAVFVPLYWYKHMRARN